MLSFLFDAIKMFLYLVFIALPLSILGTAFICWFLAFMVSIMGVIGILVGVFIILAVFMASMIR